MTDINWGLAGRTPDYASGAINAFRAGREDRKARVEDNAFAKYGQDPNGAINELMAVNPDAAMKLRQQRQQDGERQARVTDATALANNDYKGAAAAFGGAGDAASVMSANAAQADRLEKQHQYMRTIAPGLEKYVNEGGDAAKAFEGAIPILKQLGVEDDAIANLQKGFQTDPKSTVAGIMATAQKKISYHNSGDTLFVTDDATGDILATYQGNRYIAVPDGGKLVPTGGMGGMGGAPGGPSAAPAQAQAQAPAPTGGMYDQVAQIAQANGAGAADVPYLQRLAQVESAGNPGARNGSSTGLFQFHPDTFQSVGGGDINSVADQTKAALALSRRDRAALQQMGVPVTDANTYIMHQQGAGGGKALLTAPPEVNAIAALTPAYGGNAARARQAIVGNGGREDMTAGEFVNYWQNRWGGAGQGGSQPAPTQQAQASGSGMNERGDPVGTIYGNPKAQARPATAAEKAAYGIPANIPAQMKPDGSIDPITIGNGRGSGKLAPQDSKYIAEARTSSQQLSNTLPLVQRFIKLNEDVSTGGMMGSNAFSGAAALVSPKVAEMKAITDKLTPAMRQGLPGAASDRDIAMFQSATVGLGKPGPANQSVAVALKGAVKRQQDYVAYLENYARKNGSLLGAQEEWDVYASENPMFTDEGRGVLKVNPTTPWRTYFGEAAPQRSGARPQSAPAGARQSSTPAAALPAAALSQLKEGQITTFGNGQSWTSRGGKPVRVR